jgi:hypothetical protein
MGLVRAMRVHIAPVLLVCGVLAPFLPVLLSGRTLAWGVTANLFAPTRPLIVEALQDFRLPLWNPYVGTGVPLFAEALHGVLHPASVIAALLGPAAGLDLVMLLHLATASLGAFSLARVLGVSHAGAVASGFAYGLSGFTVSMTNNLPFLAGAASVPWVLAGMRLAADGRPLGVMAAGASALVCALSGDFQALSVAGVLGAALAAEGRGFRGLAWSASASAAGLLMGAIQIWPSWTHLGRSMRALPLSMLERAEWALALPRVVEWVVPGFFWGATKTPAAPVFIALGGSQAPQPFAASVFIGAPVLLLAIEGIRGSRVGRLLGASALLLLWVAFGQRFGAEQVLHSVPTWEHFRYMEKLVGPFTLCTAVLAGLGFDCLWARRAGMGKTAAGGLVLALVTLGGLTVAPMASEAVLRWGGLATTTSDAAPLARVHLAGGLKHAAAALGATVALLWWLRRGASGRLARAAVPVLLFAQSAAALPYAWHLGAARAHAPPRPPPLEAAPPGARVDVPFLPPNAPRLPGLDEVDAEHYVLARMLMPAHNVAVRIDVFRVYSGFPPMRFEALAAAHGSAVALLERRLGTTHFIIPSVLDEGSRFAAAALTTGGSQVLADPELGFTVWALPHRPWASFALGAESAADAERALAATLRLARAGDATIIVEAPAAPPVAPGRVLAIARGVDWCRIDAESDAQALLIVNDAFWPGWSATIDGRPADILPADALVRAVPWPAGRHRLEMSYEPPEINVGWIISAAGLLVLLVLAWRARSRSADAFVL